ncbi:MAG: ParB/RepB/Spo0J family partition protein [Candidatus Omnitrophica bacterium]|nr:ParB/RepB/Spo0J family partition protein [Candidatus Omnitrophota bacterium]
MDGEAKRKVLGRGLNALITDSYAIRKEASEVARPTGIPVLEPVKARAGLMEIPIKDIVPNRDQPRLVMREEALAELAESIREQGVLEPVIVTRRNSEYELICGERRVRAAALAGLEKIPAVIKEVADEKLLELALVENIQREDLNALEEAEAYLKLMESRNLTQEEVAKRVGKNRASVANTLRLLKLPKEVQELVVNQVITAGHARALVSLLIPEHQRVLAQRIVKENLSVRQAEEIVQQMLTGKRRAKRARLQNSFVADLENKLQMRLGTKVRVFNNKKNQGRIEIRYFSLDDLDRILEVLQVQPS